MVSADDSKEFKWSTVASHVNVLFTVVKDYLVVMWGVKNMLCQTKGQEAFKIQPHFYTCLFLHD